jgi:diacylglycerol O-acyltransferase / wax synthase
MPVRIPVDWTQDIHAYPGKREDRPAPTGPEVPGSRPRRCPMLAGEPGVRPVDRLTDEDQRMLWPDEIWPQDIGVLAVLDGSGLVGPSGRVRIEAVREVIAARLHLVPRFRQLLYVPGPGLGRPLWVDAPAFDLADHVQVVPVPDPCDEAALLRAAEQLRRRRLDRSRPLWQVWLLPGLAEGRVGLVVKIHHVIGDATAGMAALGALLDPMPIAPAGPTQPWTPAPPPTARDLLADNLRHYARGLGHAASALTRPVTTARHARAAWTAVREVAAGPPAARTSLDRLAGAGRTLAPIRSSLDQARQIAHRHHATVNDVLLAVTAGGLRALLRSRGEPVGGLVVPIYVPITLRPAQQRDQARGNLTALMTVPLPVGVADPGRRLEQIAAETARRKAETRPSVGTVLHGPMPRRALLAVMSHQHVNLVSADVSGPPQPLYLAGARLLEVFPVLPLMGKTTLGVGALSYAGQFNMMAVADHDACPDLDVLAAAAREELQVLTVPARATPDCHEQH